MRLCPTLSRELGGCLVGRGGGGGRFGLSGMGSIVGALTFAGSAGAVASGGGAAGRTIGVAARGGTDPSLEGSESRRYRIHEVLSAIVIAQALPMTTQRRFGA